MQLSDFKTYVKQDWKRTDKDTELVQAYNDAIIDVATRIPHGGYKYQSYVPSVLKQNNYPLPSTIIHLIHPVRYLEGSGTNDSGWPLKFISKQEYDSLEPNPGRTNPSTGKPSQYTVFSGCLLVTPIPDVSTGFFEINWTKRPTTLSANADVHLLGSEWDEVLKQMTLKRLNSGIELFDESNYWRYQYEDQMGEPIGMLKRLLDIERARENKSIGQVQNNSL